MPPRVNAQMPQYNMSNMGRTGRTGMMGSQGQQYRSNTARPQQYQQRPQQYQQQYQQQQSRQGSQGNQGQQNRQARPTNMPQGPLPDGVRFEPLDDAAMAMLKNYQNQEGSQAGGQNPQGQQNGTAQQGSQGTPNPQNPLAIPELNPSGTAEINDYGFGNNIIEENPHVRNKIEQFIQNERNGSVFYENMSRYAPWEEHKKILQSLSENCNAKLERFKTMYKAYSTEVFDAQETEVVTNVMFRDGILLAIREESAAINELADLNGYIRSEKLCKELGALINKKISDLGMLISMSFPK